MDWIDQYLDSLSDGRNAVYPPDSHTWRPVKPTKQQQSLIQDAMVSDMVRMRLIQEARQAEVDAGMGGGYDAGSAAKEGPVAPTSQIPHITSSLAPQSVYGGFQAVPFYYQITASNNPTLFGASGLHPDLSVNITTGVISGTVTTGPSQTLTATISAQNSYGISSAQLILNIFYTIPPDPPGGGGGGGPPGEPGGGGGPGGD